MSIVHLIHPPNELIFFKEQLGCSDEDMICVVGSHNKQTIIPKSNIAYIEP